MAIVGDILSSEPKESYFIPPSTVFPYAGTAITSPDGWLFCDGATYGTGVYPNLFSIIGYSYGGGGAVFAVPDLRGRVVAGRDIDNGSGTTGRLSTVTNNGTSVAVSAGSQTHTLGTAEIPSHSHGSGTVVGGATNLAGEHSHSGNVDTTNISHSHTVNVTTVNPNFDALYFRNPGYGGGAELIEHKYIRIYKSALGRDDPSSNLEDYTTAIVPVAASPANLTVDNTNPSHLHGYTTNATGSHTHTVSGTVVSGTAGAGNAHNNLQPTMVMNYIIKI